MNLYGFVAGRFGAGAANLAIVGFRALILLTIILLSDQKQQNFQYLQY